MHRKVDKNFLHSLRILQRIGVAGVFLYCICAAVPVSAQSSPGTVEINGDEVHYSLEDNEIHATGNVVITRGDITLTCDHVSYNRETQVALASGNVVLTSPDGTVTGDQLTFNYVTMKGDFMGAKMASFPYYGKGETVEKAGDNKIVIKSGYITTSDFDKPEYRIASKKIEIFPGQKAVARHVRLMVGNVPVMYIPKFVQDLREKRNNVIITPGHTKDWGGFILTAWRYHLNNNVRGTVHLDYRERKDFASGVDLDYDSDNYGKGIIRTYYTNERDLKVDRFFDERTAPTTERERFKAEWRHRWRIDDETDAIWQYYKISDSTFLKDFFENEFDEDANPETFFLLTRTLPKGTLSFRTDVRVNRFVTAVERLPELSYDFSNQQIGKSKIYLKTVNTFSNFTKKTAAPSEIRQKNMRFFNDTEVSRPFKFGILEMRPFVGGEQTFYSRTKDSANYDVIRGQFKTGADLSTKFYKTMDIENKVWGIELNRLRHIISPSVAYLFKHDPTIASSQLDEFDSIDSRTNNHTINFSLENKLQTKRKGKTVELLRAVVGTDFFLKENPGSGSFNTINSDIDFNPADWVSFYFDSRFDAQRERLKEANFDVFFRGDEWYFNVGKRFNVDVDDQLTTEFGWTINPKWKIKIYDRVDVKHGRVKELNYAVIRDLHSWEMEVNFNHTPEDGDEILFIFRLKAFPDIGFDAGTSFNQRTRGSQNQ